jgi:PIN domain nuclease of toxin-antitoxin system
MRLLIDTCIVIFWLSETDRLTKEVKWILNDYCNEIYISAVSITELISKFHKKNEIRVPQWKTAEDIVGFFKNNTHFGIKYIKEEHIKTFAKLPYLKEHNESNDRLIIAHAMTEKLTLISSDTEFPRYRKYGLDLIFNEY